MSSIDFKRLCEGVFSETESFVAALDGVPLEQPVPTCPGWTAGQLMVHVHQAQEWAAVIVETRATQRVSLLEIGGGDGDLSGDWSEQIHQLTLRALDSFGDPVDRRRLSQWITDGARRLTSALLEAGPDTAVWREFCPPRVRTWARWALLETSLHRADAEVLAAREFRIDTDLAVDSIDQWLAYVREPAAAPFLDPRLANMKGNGERLRFQPTDVDGHEGWLAVCTPQGLATSAWRPGDGDDVVVRGTASDLLLLLKRRIPLAGSSVAVTGERVLLERWLDNVLC
ncbi:MULTISPECIES: maleylpyruvate isomerase N-terminal domain-containing protein [Streptomyces]|uniref:Mycothiol-dependent maleylpyruvate isomerase metal-binding domain-containing protein n=2 Tax=Streptomyces TaxID=1883 RepID=A0A117Q7S0_STRCK|nr:maleylpyruvate isomerase N-terminal domain-containing protein [Streptomyces corchorusii]KUN13317.1 hypothetical protein AQJ11_44930 [Streptomyces corchorusii]